MYGLVHLLTFKKEVQYNAILGITVLTVRNAIYFPLLVARLLIFQFSLFGQNEAWLMLDSTEVLNSIWL